ncbi:hypothetical protein SAMN05880582_1011606 [Rhizobium sp. RU20A]|uniref:serine hydrolase domain-containing protein n=1 Tax=Rhizobium sp. RU20A TaxID=1907412 RepID=UPI000953B987|nr:serine hydrolase [Rhizobium sp. RU20A]SIQ36285.1 hypothetical protein SAMN05880582_1011606 [Rhizobium sp. RU20A]
MTDTFDRRTVTLANWRTFPATRFTYQHVSEFVPVALIRGNRQAEAPAVPLGPAADIAVAGTDGRAATFETFLAQSNTDLFVLMRGGRIVSEWAAPHADPGLPHLMFSVTKSVNALMAGVLVGQERLDLAQPILSLIPEAAGSAYADATLQQLFDMTISLDFVEDYLDTKGAFIRYRRSMGWAPQKEGEAVEDLLSFLVTLPRKPGNHGEIHAYRSPNTDLAGVAVERAAGRRWADFLSQALWKPLGATSDATVTVDPLGTARAAGGMSATARDLARMGQLVLEGGRGIVPSAFIDDLATGGSRSAWASGDQAPLFPGGSYRNYWYETGEGELAAIGIHGQWIWVDRQSGSVAVKLSSQDMPSDLALDHAIVAALRAVCRGR